jgi:hypothetical protein
MESDLRELGQQLQELEGAQAHPHHALDFRLPTARTNLQKPHRIVVQFVWMIGAMNAPS